MSKTMRKHQTGQIHKKAFKLKIPTDLAEHYN